MNHIEIIANTSKSILTEFHSLFERDGLDDIEYVQQINTIIQGTTNELTKQGLGKEETNNIQSDLQLLSRQLYIKTWLSNGEPGEDKLTATNEGINYFNFVFENEEHPS